MKLKPIALGNTLGVVAFVSFALCMAWASIDQSSFVHFWETWAHGFNLELIISDDIGSLSAKSMYGLLSFTASSWLLGSSVAWLYNTFSTQKK